MKKIYNQPVVTSVNVVCTSQLLSGSNMTNTPTGDIIAD